MADTAVIKEFLVSLGFKIDAGSERKFTETLGTTTTKVLSLGTAITTTAGLVVAGVAKIADNLEQLYFASQRTNASVENLQAAGFAARQMGVDAASALGSVENLARFLRNSPGSEGLLKNLGVSTREANGAMRDSVELMGDLGKKLAAMPYYKANAIAQTLGIDEKTLMAMRQGMGDFQQQYKDMLHAAGVDSQEAAKSSHTFMSELRLLGAAVGILSQKTATSLTGSLANDIKRFREMIVANFGRISLVINAVVEPIRRIATALVQLALRGAQAVGWLIDWFHHLSPAAQSVVSGIGALLTAWRLLNAGFLATPLGMIVGLVVGLGAALVALVDDYMTWKEGGKSLIDWGEWSPGIEEALASMKEIGQALGELAGVLLKIFGPAIDATVNIIKMLVKDAFGNLLDMINLVTDLLTGKFDKAAEHARSAMERTAKFGKYLLGQVAEGAAGTARNAQASVASGATPRALEKTAMAPMPPITPPRAPASAAMPQIGGHRSDPRGIRNFNPGNINYGDFARSHGATGVEAGPDGRFAVFRTDQEGLNALADLLRSKGYIGGGRDSVRSIISKYAPPSDNNNTAAYIRSLAKRMGVDPDAHLDAGNAQHMAGLIDGIVRIENTKNPYSKEMIAQAAARGGAAVTQTTTINVNGAGDAKGVARDVSSAQNDVNQQLVRNMRGAVQ